MTTAPTRLPWHYDVPGLLLPRDVRLRAARQGAPRRAGGGMTAEPVASPMYRIVPVGKTEARAFVQKHHRHNEAPSPMQVAFAIGLEANGELVGVLTAGWPVSRSLADGATLEVNRACVRDFHRNANSRLYGACARAAKAMGYTRLVTYTLQEESGASLKASGWRCVADIGSRTWTDSHVRVRHDVNIWGERNNAAGLPKYRWELTL